MCLRMKKCCCCSTVETGSKVIAILGIVFGVLGLLGAVVKLEIASIVMYLVSIAVSGMLLHGVKERKPAFILAYLVVTMLEIIIGALLFLVVMVFLFVLTDENGWMQEYLPAEMTGDLSATDRRQVNEIIRITLWVVLVVVLAVSALNLYFWAVVWSHYKDVQEEYIGGNATGAGVEMGYGRVGDNKSAPAANANNPYGGTGYGGEKGADLPPPYPTKGGY